MDVVSGRIVNVGQAVTACSFAACYPRTPWRVDGTKVTFLTFEEDQGQQDLDGNGASTDLVLQVFDFCTEVLTPLDRVDTDANNDPFTPQDDTQLILSESGRCDQGITCDPLGADGYRCDRVTRSRRRRSTRRPG